MSQEIGTSIGKVDCAANVGRCVIAAKLSGVAGTGAMKWSPIGFTEPTLEKLTISASPAGALRDGSSIKVTGSGGLPGESIMITQCVPGAGPNSIGTCDAIRGAQAVIADDGAYSIDYIAYRDILTTSTDDSSPSTWVPCEPCVLTAIRSNGQGTSATTSIELVSAPNPIHPKVQLVGPGPSSRAKPCRCGAAGSRRLAADLRQSTCAKPG